MLKLIRTDRPWNQYRFPPELIAWRDAVIANGGARPSVREMVRRNRLIRNHMLSGAWALTDDILMSGEDEVQSLVSLKRRFLCIRWNSPQFYIESGFILDGYASYIEWPFIPATHAVAMTTTNQRAAVWNLANVGTNGFALGATSNVTTGTPAAGLGIRPLQNGSMRINFGSATVNFTLSDATAVGFSVGSRTSNTAIRGYKDGVRFADVTGQTIIEGLASRPLFVGGRNHVGDLLSLPTNCVIPYAAIGAQLTDAQERATYEGVRDAVARMFYGEDDEEDD